MLRKKRTFQMYQKANATRNTDTTSHSKRAEGAAKTKPPRAESPTKARNGGESGKMRRSRMEAKRTGSFCFTRVRKNHKSPMASDFTKSITGTKRQK